MASSSSQLPETVVEVSINAESLLVNVPAVESAITTDHNDDTAAKKRSPDPLEPTDGEAVKKARSDDISEAVPTVEAGKAVDLQTLRKQIEYYFSDDNMKHDKFFHTKISADPEGWLDINHVLCCKKIQSLNATQEDIIKALQESSLETKVDGNNVGWIRRLSPLPSLEPRPPRAGKGTGRDDAQRYSRSVPKTVSDIHTYGCFLKLTGIPEEASWVPVKEALLAALPEGAKLRHVSSVSADGIAYVYSRKFPDDVAVLSACTSIIVNNTPVNVNLVNDIPTVAKIIDTHLPKNIVRDREREIVKIKADNATRPLMIGGSRFQSIEHLRKCYRELLDLTAPDTNLKPTAFQIIRAVLNYHPNAEQKARDLEHIKVAFRTDISKKPDDKPTKCFFVVRKDGTCEDFSMLKCIEAMMRDPPFVKEPEKETVETPPTIESSPTDTTPTSEEPQSKKVPVPA